MRAFLAAATACALVIATASAADAAQQKKRYAKRAQSYTASKPVGYSGGTPRQRANSAAFDRGGYYESIADQHVFGSRSWWILKERELGGGSLP